MDSVAEIIAQPFSLKLGDIFPLHFYAARLCVSIIGHLFPL